MRTLICNSPGNFEYGEAETPKVTKGHALLKIKRIGICGTDLHAFEGTQPYFTYPRILGHELAAELVDADGTTEFSKGETLTLLPYFHCGSCIACRSGKTNCCVNLRVFGVHMDGGMADYVTVPTNSLIHGAGLGPDALAVVEPMAIGAHAIRRADITPGEYTLVIGAGPIGLGVIEFARMAGAQVIVMDISESRLKFCKEKLKLTHTLNGNQPDIVKQLQQITNGDMPTLVIDATGSQKAIISAFNFMAHTGRYILVGLQKGDISFSHPEFHKREATLMSSRNATREDFEHVIQAMKKGLVVPTDYITHRVVFSEVKSEFASWLNPANGVIKAMVEL